MKPHSFLSRWQGAVALWQARARARRELGSLDDCTLRDLGLSHRAAAVNFLDARTPTMIDNTFHATLIALFVALLGLTGVPPDAPPLPDAQAVHQEIVKVFDAPREI